MKRMEEQKHGSRKVRGMLSPKCFKNLDAVMAILELFEQFFDKCLFFFASNPDFFTKLNAFC